MVLSRKDVDHIAKLSRLELSEAEKEKFTRQLDQILASAEALKRVPTDQIVPTSHAIPMDTLFREDEPRVWPDKEALLSNAPERDGDFYSVPRILEDEA
jgi:aspartyl-tRNA(Asn)/glutamyl-tRNA(Gln) amidotransferase subunit C